MSKVHAPIARALRTLIVSLGVASCGSSAGGDGTPTGTSPSPTPTPPATFSTLTIVGGGAGSGSGQVTSNTGGVSCTITNGAAAGACSASFSSGSVVQLQVASGTLTGWAGDCTGTTVCQVTMNANRQVTATFLAVATPIIVLKTTKPVVVADRIQQTIIVDYSIQNGGGGTLTPAISNANPDYWIQLAIVGGNTLRATINAVGLRSYSEEETQYVVSVAVTAPGASSVPVTLKFAKTIDSPVGMAATVVRFHQNSGHLSDPPPPTAFAQISLLDSRTNTPIAAKVDAVDPSDQNWLETPTINSGQLELRVKQADFHSPAGNLPSPGNPFGSPIRIKLTAANGGSTCPAFSVPPDPTCQIFVYYTADPFPRLFLRPWGLQLTPAAATQSAAIEVQNPSTPTATPTVLKHTCGNALNGPPIISNPQSGTKVTVSGNFAAISEDSTVRCQVVIVGDYLTDTGLATDTATLTVTLGKPSADVITPSQRDLNILATAGAGAPQADTITLYNLGPNAISVAAPNLAGTSAGGFAACPASLLVTPTLVGTTIGKGNIALVAVRVNPVGQVAQACAATLRLTSATPGVVAQDIPVLIRLK